MVDITKYIAQLIDLLKHQYGERLTYVGLQGSYLRGEATDKSDIDIMVVIENLNINDLDCYRTIISAMEEPEKSCGFICSKADLKNWNPLEIPNLLNNTKDYYGVLNQLVPFYTEHDIRNFIKISINNLYHELCHRYIHAEKNENIEQLPYSYKNVFFILQNMYYLESRKYIPTKSELLPLLLGRNHAVLKRAIQLSNGMKYDFTENFHLIFTWCQDTMKIL